MKIIKTALAVVLCACPVAQAGAAPVARGGWSTLERLEGARIVESASSETLVRQGAIWSDGAAATDEAVAAHASAVPESTPIPLLKATQAGAHRTAPPAAPPAEQDAPAGFTRAECFKSGLDLVVSVPMIVLSAIPVLGWAAAVVWLAVSIIPGVIVGGIFAATRTHMGGV